MVNPPLWELGHIAWFQEYWCRRLPDGMSGARAPSRYAHFDDWYNSSDIAHAPRWALPHPGRKTILQHLRETLDDTQHALQQADPSRHYFFELALLHEAMHAEAFLMTLQTLALPFPRSPDLAWDEPAAHADTNIALRDVEFAGGEFLMGTAPGTRRFVFDNEKWARPRRVQPFAIASHCVSNVEYMQFVDDQGYSRRELWTSSGWDWRTTANATHPLYWRREDTRWTARKNDTWEALDPDLPMIHVNLHEAEAWCAWAKRRLPSEAEWEFAATAGGTAQFPWGDGATLLRECAIGARSDRPAPSARAPAQPGPLAHMIGNVWEWTSTPFEPYPAFAPDPYADYSAPWFGNHTVVRGGSFVTSPWLIHGRFRNFYMPHRCDVFAGFRTCAIGV